MNNTHKKRLFILGSGFSKPAGLPLGNELLKEIKAYSDALSGEEYRRVLMYSGELPKTREKDALYFLKTDENTIKVYPSSDTDRVETLNQENYSALLAIQELPKFPLNKGDNPTEITGDLVDEIRLTCGGYTLTNMPAKEIKEIFQSNLNEYISYSKQTIESINIEEFIEYLDIKHYLNLFGFEEDSQAVLNPDSIHLIIRNLITAVLSEKQNSLCNSELYEEFIELITPDDILITLNYDTLLENFYKQKKDKIFNFFPPYVIKKRLGSQENNAATLLKIHGSINWFNYKEYEYGISSDRKYPSFRVRPNFIFNNENPAFFPKSLLNSSYELNVSTRLNDIYWIEQNQLTQYVEFNKTGKNNFSPLILSPSYTKLLYADAIKDLFTGLGNYGYGEFDKIIVIGCSVPKYDRYIKQLLHCIVKQYTGFSNKKDILIVAKPNCDHELRELTENYSAIISNNKYDLISEGFSLNVLNDIKS